jgi:uncharacterized delta-60 repeat protein
MYTTLCIARIFGSVFFVLVPAIANAAPGSLDPTFGHGGFRLFAHETYSANDIKIQSNGRILVAGDTAGTGNAIGGFSVVRLLADGRSDTHFGNAGLAVARFNSGLNIANSLALQSDAKIVAVGDTVEDSPDKPRAMAIARFMPDGSLDSNFGSNGTVELIVDGSTNSFATVVLLLSNDKILVGGGATYSSGRSGVVVRLNANGTVDTTFGAAGVAKTGSIFAVNCLGTQANGKIVALSGSTAVRFLSDGRIDSQRNRGTLVTQAHSGTSMLTPGEKILESLGVHDTQSGSDIDTQAFRLFPDGSNDPSFVSPIFDYLSDVSDIYQNVPFGIALQGDGSVLIAGSGQNTNAVFEGALARLAPGGALDPNFGQGGIATSVLDGNDQFTALAQQSDGKIVAAGLSFASNGDLVIARYTSR